MNLNTESIVNDVTKVVQNGLKDILSEIETKYKLYEESHNCAVKMAECMSKQVSRATTANAIPNVDTYVSRAEFNALVKQNQELMKHIACEFVSQSKQNQDMLKQLAIMKQDMASLLSRAVIDVDSDEETNITLKIEEIKTNDNLIGGSLETLDDKIVVAGDKQGEEEEEESDEEESDEEEESEEEEEEKVDSVKIVNLDAPTEKHITNDGGLITASEVDEEEVEEEEEEDSDEEKEQLEDDEKDDDEKDGEEEELYEIVFNSTTYCTDDDVKGSLYILTSDGDVGDKVGHLVNGKPIFY